MTGGEFIWAVIGFLLGGLSVLMAIRWALRQPW